MSKNNIINFLKQHKDIYPEYFEKNRLQKIKYGYTCDINQIYCYLNEIDITKTDYFRFFKLIETYFDLNNLNIAEVGCGYIPILSSIIKQNSNCEITAINNKIIINNYNNIKTLETDLSYGFHFNNYDLIIGFRPCNITEQVIIDCFTSNKDFIIYLCPCAIEPLNINYFNKEKWTYKDWHKYLINIVKKNKNYDVNILYNHSLDDDCPIIIAKTK